MRYWIDDLVILSQGKFDAERIKFSKNGIEQEQEYHPDYKILTSHAELQTYLEQKN